MLLLESSSAGKPGTQNGAAAASPADATDAVSARERVRACMHASSACTIGMHASCIGMHASCTRHRLLRRVLARRKRRSSRADAGRVAHLPVQAEATSKKRGRDDATDLAAQVVRLTIERDEQRVRADLFAANYIGLASPQPPDCCDAGRSPLVINSDCLHVHRCTQVECRTTHRGYSSRHAAHLRVHHHTARGAFQTSNT